MAKHSSATAHTDTPHVLELSRTNTIVNALKRRAQAVLNDESLDAQSRAIIRYGLETNDPWLAELVRRAEASESVVDTFHCGRTRESNDIRSKPATSEVESTPETGAVDLTTETGAVDPTSETNAFEQSGGHDNLSKEKIEALAEIICQTGNHSAAALFVLMGALEIPRIPRHSQTRRSTLLSRAAGSRMSSEWLTLSVR